MRYYLQRNSHKIVRTVLVLAIIGGLIVGARYFISNRGEIGNLDDHASLTTQGDLNPVSVNARVLATGNVSWGGDLARKAEASPAKTAYPFSGLNTFSRNEYDAWVGNLSCTISSEASTSTSCSGSYLSELKKWFNVLALSNVTGNTQSSVDSTRSSLDKIAMQYVGSSPQDSTESLCEIITLPARFKLGDGSYKVANLPIALCSYSTNGGAPDNKVFDEVGKYAKQLPVWVYVNSGETTAVTQSDLQKSIYKAFIDVGADIILGDNPSVVQGAESYKGKLIIYSLGNFMYAGSSSDAELHQSVSLKVTISAPADTNMLGWTQLAGQCVVTHDTCLSLSKTKGLNRPSYTYALSVVPADNLKEGITMTNTSMWEEQALKRLDWDSVLPALTYMTK